MWRLKQRNFEVHFTHLYEPILRSSCCLLPHWKLKECIMENTASVLHTRACNANSTKGQITQARVDPSHFLWLAIIWEYVRRPIVFLPTIFQVYFPFRHRRPISHYRIPLKRDETKPSIAHCDLEWNRDWSSDPDSILSSIWLLLIQYYGTHEWQVTGTHNLLSKNRFGKSLWSDHRLR